MKIIWSPAVTLDGYIAKSDGDSDWVSEKDGELFNELTQQCGCVIVGHKTYEQYKGEVFPVAGATTFVWTTKPNTPKPENGVEYVSGDPSEVVKLVEEKGFSSAVLAGGGETNNAFVAAGLVNEITITIYPLVFGEGIRLLTAGGINFQLKLLKTEVIGKGIIRNHYQVLKDS